MLFQRATLESCSTALGAVVVIDVLRAFTTAAYAFDAGARDILMVSSVEEAFSLRRRFPGSLTMGEVSALPIEGFDFSNSPSALMGVDLSGRRLIQRTTAGTQGVVRSSQAEVLLAASLCCARATARLLSRLSPTEVTFVITGAASADQGAEDAACADLIQSLVLGREPDTAALARRVRASAAAAKFADPDRPQYPAPDLDCCLELDRFGFAMAVRRRDGLLVLESVSAD